MSITGIPEGPPVRLGVAVADIVSGMFAFQGLLLALLSRGRTGRGQLVDVSLLDSVAALLTYQASRHFATGEVPVRTGNRHMTIAPYDTFETADGVMVLAVGNDVQWRRLCGALEAHGPRRGRSLSDQRGPSHSLRNPPRLAQRGLPPETCGGARRTASSRGCSLRWRAIDR